MYPRARQPGSHCYCRAACLLQWVSQADIKATLAHQHSMSMARQSLSRETEDISTPHLTVCRHSIGRQRAHFLCAYASRPLVFYCLTTPSVLTLLYSTLVFRRHTRIMAAHTQQQAQQGGQTRHAPRPKSDFFFGSLPCATVNVLVCVRLGQGQPRPVAGENEGGLS